MKFSGTCPQAATCKWKDLSKRPTSNLHSVRHSIHQLFKVLPKGRDTFVQGSWRSSLVMPWLSCKLKTKKKGHNLLATVLPTNQTSQLYLLFITAYKSLPQCFSKNIVTALLEYFDLDCSIRVFRIQLQIIQEGLSSLIVFFYRYCSPSSPPPLPKGNYIDSTVYIVWRSQRARNARIW